MAKLIDLDSFQKLFYSSNFKARSINVSEFLESSFGPVLNNPVNIEPSIIDENWPCFNIISNVNFIVNSSLVQCMLSSVNVKPTGVSKLFCDYPNLIWEHVKNIPSRPLTNLTKVPQFVLTRYFAVSIKADMVFSH